MRIKGNNGDKIQWLDFPIIVSSQKGRYQCTNNTLTERIIQFIMFYNNDIHRKIRPFDLNTL